MKKTVTVVGVVVILTTMISVRGATRRVPRDYPTIQSAIYDVDNGDTILVDPGEYAENIDFFNKQITLQGVPGPTFQKDAPGYYFQDTFTNVTDADAAGYMTFTDTSAAGVSLNIQFEDGGVTEDEITVTVASGTSKSLTEIVDLINAETQNLGNDAEGVSKNYVMASAVLATDGYYHLRLDSRLSDSDGATMTVTSGGTTQVAGSGGYTNEGGL